jgi:PEGA domain-containing protein
LIALVMLACRAASAAPSIGVVVVGEPTLQGKVRAQMGVWIHQHGYTLVPKPLSAEAQKTLTNCFVIEDTGCARGVYTHQAKVDYLVYVHIDLAAATKAKQRDVDLSGYWFAKDREPAGDKRACKSCSNSSLNQSVVDLMSALFDATALAKARLRIGTPPGLVVQIDGHEVGVTPIEQDVSPGPHTIALVRDGKELGSTQLDTKGGDLTDVVIPIKSELPPPPPHDEKPPPPHDEKPPPPPPPPPAVRPHDGPSRVAPGLLIVTGLGAVATGGVFVYYGQKNGINDPIIYPHATKEGAIIAGVGGVVLITGLIWWWHGSSSNGPTASIGSGGTMIGWEGRF